MRALRARILVGAVLWTLGLIAAVGITYPWLFVRRGRTHPVRVITIIHSPLLAYHTLVLLAFAVACMIAGFLLVRRAFSPLDTMRTRLADVRRGAAGELRGEYPAEVQPLVDDLNAMLAHNDRTVGRAIAKAADLAHGLKTPLAVLSAEAERLAAQGRAESAEVVAEQVSRMRRQIDYQLAQARAAASGSPLGGRTPVAQVVDGLVRALRRLDEGRGIAIDAEIGERLAFRGRAEDLEEMLGNLMENACRWAAARVHVSVAAAGGRLAIAVDDDGPGLAPELRESVLRRGVRADEGAPGSGLGLAIARELAELYGGSIALESSPAGGLRARLDLPAADGS